MLKQCDIFLETPLKYLIENMPGRPLCVHKLSLYFECIRNFDSEPLQHFRYIAIVLSLQQFLDLNNKINRVNSFLK